MSEPKSTFKAAGSAAHRAFSYTVDNRKCDMTGLVKATGEEANEFAFSLMLLLWVLNGIILWTPYWYASPLFVLVTFLVWVKFVRRASTNKLNSVELIDVFRESKDAR